MHDFELEQLRRNPTWRATLKAYWEAQQAGRANQAEFDGWIPRLPTVESVDPAQLSSVHGRLIAFGFLKFDLSSRDLGMRYQLTPIARQAIGAEPVAADSAGTELAELAETA